MHTAVELNDAIQHVPSHAVHAAMSCTQTTLLKATLATDQKPLSSSTLTTDQTSSEAMNVPSVSTATLFFTRDALTGFFAWKILSISSNVLRRVSGKKK